MTMLESLAKAAVVKTESTNHGMFVKMFFDKNKVTTGSPLESTITKADMMRRRSIVSGVDLGFRCTQLAVIDSLLDTPTLSEKRVSKNSAGFETLDNFLNEDVDSGLVIDTKSRTFSSLPDTETSDSRLPIFCSIASSESSRSSSCDRSVAVEGLVTQVASALRSDGTCLSASEPMDAAAIDTPLAPLDEALCLPDYFDEASFSFCPLSASGGEKTHSVMPHGQEDFARYVSCHVNGRVFSAQVVASIDRCCLAAMNVDENVWAGARGPFAITNIVESKAPHVVKVSCELVPEILVKFNDANDANMFVSVVRFSLDHRKWREANASDVVSDVISGVTSNTVIGHTASASGRSAAVKDNVGDAHPKNVSAGDPNVVNKSISKRDRKKKR